MDQSIGAQEQPRFIKLNARDNVADRKSVV